MNGKLLWTLDSVHSSFQDQHFAFYTHTNTEGFQVFRFFINADGIFANKPTSIFHTHNTELLYMCLHF